MMQTFRNAKQINFNTIIYVLIFSLLMSFFGYLYEQIDFIPNYLLANNPKEISVYWSKFHYIVNPAHYHILPATLTLFCLLYIWINRKRLNKLQYKSLILVTTLIIIVNILTVIAVFQINDKLYFSKEVNNQINLKWLAIVWSFINIIRLLILFICSREIYNKFKTN